MKVSNLWTWPKKLWALIRPYLPTSVDQLANTTAALLPIALPIVRGIAELTPTRSDDEMIALFDRYALPGVNAWLALPADQRGKALLYAAAELLKRQTPDVADRIIDMAVQLAYAGWREEQGA